TTGSDIMLNNYLYDFLSHAYLCKDTKNRTVFLMFGCLSLVAVWSLKMKNAGVLAKTCRTFL
ncbi:hypothetical protein, partial [Phocaeicola coprocola]